MRADGKDWSYRLLLVESDHALMSIVSPELGFCPSKIYF